MNLEHYRGLLLTKERELSSDLSQVGPEASDSATPEVQDEMDRVVSSEAKDLLMNQKSHDLDLLKEVRGALRRIEDGTYGKCQLCGRQIEPKRLEAVPWAAFDLEHQEQRDAGLQ